MQLLLTEIHVDDQSIHCYACIKLNFFFVYCNNYVTLFFKEKRKKALAKTGLAKTGLAGPLSTAMLPIEANYLLIWIPHRSSTSDSHKQHRH